MKNSSNNFLARQMTKPFIRVFSLILGIGFLLLQTILPSYGDYNVTQQQYYPSLSGQYSNIRLVPRPTLSDPCIIGTIYSDANNSDEILFCQDDGQGTGIWGHIPGNWRQVHDVLYTIDTDPNLTTTIGSTTPKFKLTLEGNGGIIAKGTFASGVTLASTGSGARLMWYPRKAAFRAGELSATGSNKWDDAKIGSHSAVTGGLDNMAAGDFSGVGGGTLNSALAKYSTIGGGRKNLIDTDATYGTIGGGGSTLGVVGDDFGNTVYGVGGFIGGGEVNFAGTLNDAVNSADATVCSSINNKATNKYSAICAGSVNFANGLASSICSGNSIADGQWATIAAANATQGPPAILSNAQGDYSFVAGGFGNIASGSYATIGLGKRTPSSADSPSKAAANHSVIITGDNNGILASGLNSVMVTGENNVISGQYSVIPTGDRITIDGDYSLAMGKNMTLKSTKTKSFVWGHSNTTKELSHAGGFIIYSGNVGIGVLSPSEKLDISEKLLVNGTGKSIILSNPPTVNNDHLRWKNDTSVIGLDLAEIFETSEPVEPTDVLIIDDQSTAKLKKSQHSYDTKVVGIVSANPAVLLEESHMTISPAIPIAAHKKQAALALAGRVHCKVTDQGGAISVGDLLTTSDIEGHAMKASNRAKSKGAIIGKALESFSFTSGNKKGIIAVYVDLQ